MLHRKLPQLGDATQEELLFDALMQPVRGMLSKPHPATLGPGQWALIQNFRRDRGVLRVRGGSASISSDLSAFGFRGAAQLRVNGVNNLFCAWATHGTPGSADIAIFKRDNSTGNWSEISATSGKYGATRFQTDTEDYVRFAAVHDKFTNRDLVIIQNGADDARIYDDGSSDVKMAIIRNIAAPHKSIQKVQALFNQGFKLQSDVISFPTNVGSGITGAFAGTAVPNYYIELTAVAGVAANDYVDINLNIQSYNYAATGDQALFLVDLNGYEQWLDNLEILMRDMNLPSDTTIWKGNDSKYTRYRVNFDAEGRKEMIAFPIRHIPTEKRAGVFAFRFKWIGGSGSPPAGGVKMSIYMINPSGWVPGGTQYGFTFFNRGSRSESGPAYSEVYETMRVQDMGGTALGGARLPMSPLLHYTYRIHYTNITQAEADLGTDAMRLYRKMPGESQFHLMSQGGIAGYSGGVWTVTNGAGALTDVDDTGIEEQLFLRGIAELRQFSVKHRRFRTRNADASTTCFWSAAPAR